MSFAAVKWVIEHGPHLGLDDYEYRVLLHLADRMNTKTGQLNPSPERLAIDCGRDPKTTARQVIRVLRRLEAKGRIERVGSSKGGKGQTQQYRLNLTPNPVTAAMVTDGQTLSSAPPNPVIGAPKPWRQLPGEPVLQPTTNLRSGSTTPTAPPPTSGGAVDANPNGPGRISDAYDPYPDVDEGTKAYLAKRLGYKNKSGQEQERAS